MLLPPIRPFAEKFLFRHFLRFGRRVGCGARGENGFRGKSARQRALAAKMAPWRPESVQSGKADAPALSARRGVKDALSATLSASHSSHPYLCGCFPQKKPFDGPKACKTESGRARSFRPQGSKRRPLCDPVRALFFAPLFVRLLSAEKAPWRPESVQNRKRTRPLFSPAGA